jgi:hypothetical protein
MMMSVYKTWRDKAIARIYDLFCWWRRTVADG